LALSSTLNKIGRLFDFGIGKNIFSGNHTVKSLSLAAK
jgi:hypothetical protein